MQIENEYGPVEWEIGAPGKAYTKWFSSMAVGLNTGVPWIMCKQDDVPDPIVSDYSAHKVDVVQVVKATTSIYLDLKIESCFIICDCR